MSLTVLVAGDFGLEWRAPAWSTGLQALGVEVLTYDWRQDYSPGLLGRFERRFLVGPGIWRINRNLRQRAKASSPDVVLIYAGESIMPATVCALAKLHWVTGYHNDDAFGPWGYRPNFRYYRPALKFYTSHHVFRSVNVPEVEAAGCPRVALLLHFYLPWLYQPLVLAPEDQRRLGADVVFVGSGIPRGRRIEYLTALVEMGVSVRIFGHPSQWYPFLSREIAGAIPRIVPVGGLDAVKALCAARICPAFFNSYNRDDYTVRTFEIPACGGFMMSERTATVQSLFVDGKEVVCFDSKDEFVNLVRYYLGNDRDRRQIATAGLDRCRHSGYDVFSRMRQWLTDVRRWMNDSDYPV